MAATTEAAGAGAAVAAPAAESDVPATAPAHAPERIVTVAVVAVLTLQMSGSRWCARVGRQHRGNHVAWHVDVEAGLAWHTCFDRDCRGFRSRRLPVPRC